MYINKLLILVIAAIATWFIYYQYQEKINIKSEHKKKTKEFVINLLEFYNRDFYLKILRSQEMVSLSNDIMLQLQQVKEFLISENKGVIIKEWEKSKYPEPINALLAIKLKESFNKVPVQLNTTDDLGYRKNYTGDVAGILFLYSSKTINYKWDGLGKPQDIKIIVKIVNKVVQNKHEELIIKENDFLANYFSGLRLVLDINEYYCFQIDFHDTFNYNKINSHCLASESINNYFDPHGSFSERGYFYNLLLGMWGNEAVGDPIRCYRDYCNYSKSTQ